MNYTRLFNSLRISVDDEISQLAVYLAQHFNIDLENVNILIKNFFEKNESETKENETKENLSDFDERSTTSPKIKSFPRPKSYERSFASHPKAKFWSLKNPNTPRDFFKGSNKKCLFNCNICKHEFERKLYHVKQGKWCSYCAGKKLCTNGNCKWCLEKSFASHQKAKFWSLRNKKLKPRNIRQFSDKKCWFNCIICKHEFRSQLKNISNGRWCPYCCIPSRLLCKKRDCKWCIKKSFVSHPKAKFWSSKNKLKPRNVRQSSHDKFLFNCKIYNHEFETQLNDVVRGRWCSKCTNKTELKLFEWLTEKYSSSYEIVKEFRAKWCKNAETNNFLPFDFLVEELPPKGASRRRRVNLIIELDGAQHFTQVSNWKDPEKTRKRDIYKMKAALDQGYSVIRLLQDDVYRDKNNWKENLTSSIHHYDTPQIIYICTNNEYSEYQKEFE